MNVVSIKKLLKRYGDLVAVDNINLEIKEGEIFGLLGPNGAGKSTTINILSSILNPTAGEVKLFELDIKKDRNEIKKRLGVVPQNIALYNSYTAYENVKFFGELYGLRGEELNKGIERALNITGLIEYKKKITREFSGGMQRRLNIACALVHSPKLLIMDEPTVGIDPQSRNHILDAVKKLNNEGVTIIYTTHYMEEVEKVCDRLAIIDKGKIIVEGTKDEVKNMVSDKKVVKIEVDDSRKVDIKDFRNVRGVESIHLEGDEFSIYSTNKVNNLSDIIDYLNDKSLEIKNIRYDEITLETVFLTLTGRKLRD